MLIILTSIDGDSSILNTNDIYTGYPYHYIGDDLKNKIGTAIGRYGESELFYAKETIEEIIEIQKNGGKKESEQL